jgi:flagellar basal-body rod modification protein FlgD
MSVAPISTGQQGSQAPNAADANASSTGALTQSQFYQIITAQLQNQDPENATDTNAMVQDMMSLANYQATQSDSVALTTMKNYMTAVSLIGGTVDITVPATNSSAATTVTGVVTKASFGNSGAAVTVNGTEYTLDDVTDVAATPAADNGGSGGSGSTK